MFTTESILETCARFALADRRKKTHDLFRNCNQLFETFLPGKVSVSIETE